MNQLLTRTLIFKVCLWECKLSTNKTNRMSQVRTGCCQIAGAETQWEGSNIWMSVIMTRASQSKQLSLKTSVPQKKKLSCQISRVGEHSREPAICMQAITKKSINIVCTLESSAMFGRYTFLLGSITFYVAQILIHSLLSHTQLYVLIYLMSRVN